MLRKIVWTVFTLLVVGAVLAGFRTRNAAFALLLAGTWALTLVCLYFRKDEEKRESFLDRLIACTVPCLAPMGLATAFYVSLAAYLSFYGGSVSIAHLASMERFFGKASAFFTHSVTLNAAQVFMLLFVGELFACLLLAARPGKTQHLAGRPSPGMQERMKFVTSTARGFKRYRSMTGPVGVLLATLAAFTVLGVQQAGPLERNVHLRVETAHKSYAKVARQVQSEVTEQVTRALYYKIDRQLPKPYRAAFSQVAQAEKVADQVNAEGGNRAVRTDVSDSRMVSQVTDELSQSKQAETTQTTWQVSGQPQASEPDGTVTVDQATTAASEVSLPQKGAIAIINNGPKAITLQLESVGSENLLEVLKPLTSSIPLAEPVLSALSDTLNETLQERIGQLVDRFTREAVARPADLENKIEAAADQLAAGTDVSTEVKRVIPQANLETSHMRRTLSVLLYAKEQIQRAAAKPSELDRPLSLPESLHLPSGLRLEIPPPLPSDLQFEMHRPLPPNLEPPSLTDPPSGSAPSSTDPEVPDDLGFP